MVGRALLNTYNPSQYGQVGKSKLRGLTKETPVKDESPGISWTNYNDDTDIGACTRRAAGSETLLALLSDYDSDWYLRLRFETSPE